MASYNGLIAKLTKGGNQGVTTLLNGVSSMTVDSGVINMPKYFSNGIFAVKTLSGVSGTFGVDIIGAVGDAQIVIAGRTAISAVGSFVVPSALGGTTWSGVGFPRPTSVNFSGSNVAGFTASVWFAGEYN